MTDTKAVVVAEEDATFRKLPGAGRYVQWLVLSAMPVLGVLFVFGAQHWIGLTLYTEQYLGVMLTLVLMGTFLSVPAGPGSPLDRLPPLDLLLCLASLPAGLYIAWFYPEIAHRLGQADTTRIVLALITIALVFEAIRRLIGWPLMIVVAVIFLYARFAAYFPGLLQGRSMQWPQLLNYMYLDPNSMLSMLQLGATIGLAFIVFGQVLLLFGGGRALIGLATSLFGRLVGGASKVSVVSSSLFGSVSGAPMANVILTGSFTIPLMKRFRYPSHTAGAVEAVASTGGQILPPVMGIAGFLIAENLRIPYADVALGALVPALLFYVSLYIFTDFEARKLGIAPLTGDQLDPMRTALLRCLPTLACFSILIHLIFVVRYNVATAGVITAMISVVVLAFTNGNYRRLLPLLSETLEGSGRMLLSVCVALAAAGLVVGAISVSGIGFILTQTFSRLGEHSLTVLLLLTAVTTIILGMGMPTVAAYALVAVLMAPGLVAHDIPPLAAHLFVLYYAVLSNITPPIALASFAAAPLAGAHPNKVAVESVRIGIVAFLVPMAFVLRPALILQGTWLDLFVALVIVGIGVVLVTVAAVGHFFILFSRTERIVLFVAGGFMFTAMETVVGPLGLIVPALVGIAVLARRVVPAFKAAGPSR